MHDWIPLHGGDLQRLQGQTHVPTAEWVDLSTGVNCRAYPFSAPRPQAYTAMPYLSPDLVKAAEAYYGYSDPLVVAGVESIIPVLSQCLILQPMLVPDIGYGSYAKFWQEDGREVLTYPASDSEEAARAIDEYLQINTEVHLLIINPNNPSGICVSPDQIRRWSNRLAVGSCLLVDEAFMDCTPDASLLNHELPQNLLVFRSFGKFFGLPGLRLGFVFGDLSWRQLLASRLGAWPVSGPAQAIGTQALLDREWQVNARATIARDAQTTIEMVSPLMSKLTAYTPIYQGLFCAYRLPNGVAKWLYQHWLRMGVLLRPVAINEREVLMRIGIVNADNPTQLLRLQKSVARTLDYLQTIDTVSAQSIVPGIGKN